MEVVFTDSVHYPPTFLPCQEENTGFPFFVLSSEKKFPQTSECCWVFSAFLFIYLFIYLFIFIWMFLASILSHA